MGRFAGIKCRQDVHAPIDCEGEAGSQNAPFQQIPFLLPAPVPEGFFYIGIADIIHGLQELSCVHKNTPFSKRYCFSFRRMRVSRTETFFTVSPVCSAISS